MKRTPFVMPTPIERGFVMAVWIHGAHWYEGWATKDGRTFVFDQYTPCGLPVGGEDWPRIRPRDPNRKGGGDRPDLLRKRRRL